MYYESYLQDIFSQKERDTLNQFSFNVLGNCDERLSKRFKTVDDFILYLLFYKRVTVDQANTINDGVSFHRKRISDPKLYDPTEESLHQDLFYYACFFLLAYIPNFLSLYNEYYIIDVKRVHRTFIAYVNIQYVNKNSSIRMWNKKDRDKYQRKSFDIFLNILIMSKFKNMDMDMRDIIDNIKRFGF